MVSPVDFVAGALTVTRRNFLVWVRTWLPNTFAFVIDPIIYLFALGLGLGTVMAGGDLGMPFLVFLVPGMMASAVLFAALVEGTYSALSRLDIQQTYKAILCTPITLGQLVLGEMLWGACKATLGAAAVLVVGFAAGAIVTPLTALLTLPVAFLAGMCLMALGLCITSLARTFDHFSYTWPTVFTPMFLLSGMFMEISAFPTWVQAIAYALPASHAIAVMRGLTSGVPLDAALFAVHLGYLVVLTVVLSVFAHKGLHRRVFS